MPPSPFRLYLVTDRTRTGGRPLLDVIESALQGGVDAVQLREKDLPARDVFDLACRLRVLCDRYGARLLINDRIDVALAAKADGVHLPVSSFSPADARRLLGLAGPGNQADAPFDELRVSGRSPLKSGRGSALLSPSKHEPVEAWGGVLQRAAGCLVGASAHSLAEACAAAAGGADFIVFGPIFDTPSKRPFGSPVGLEALAQVARELAVPVFGIGGISADGADAVCACGAGGVAVISAILAADDPRAAAREIKSLIEG